MKSALTSLKQRLHNTRSDQSETDMAATEQVGPAATDYEPHRK